MNKILLPSFLLCFVFISCNNSNQEKVIEKTVEINETVLFPEKITFPSLDSLPISANVYETDKDAPVIVLCHQARYNKFEYSKIAESLNKLGFTCIAIDQRSGGPLGEEFNETNTRAKALNKPVDYLDAEQDIVAAVNFAANKYNKKIILWGSSYSSTLALYIALENNNVAAVISFSPGDYFAVEKGTLKDKITKINKPMFVTSSKEESLELSKLFEKVPKNSTTVQFVPKSVGTHGSRALWKTDENNKEYWNAIESFLKEIKSINFNK